MSVLVRHDLRRGVTRPDFFAADDNRNLDPLGRHRGQLVLQRFSFGGPRRVRIDGFVDRNRNSISHTTASSSQFTPNAMLAKGWSGFGVRRSGKWDHIWDSSALR